MTTQHEHHGEIEFTQEFWDDRYQSADRLWSGKPNAQLVAQASDLTAGAALDVGCGEGADAIWLAKRGWQVTAVDVSAVALERAARHAATHGEQIAGRISWRREDMYSFDPGARSFDLVSAQFMYLPRQAFAVMLTRLAAAVRPGGTLLVVGHHPDDMHARGAAVADMAWTAEQLAAALDASDWEIVMAAAIERQPTELQAAQLQAASPDHRPMTAKDTVLRARRHE
jgi:2-polyprenyl-3-methyl-5-hydroxy-6-metoxy-1,4-benzoquinol methylase